MEDVSLAECRVLRVQPGDVVIYETDARVTPERGKAIKAHLEQLLARAGHAGVHAAVVSQGCLVTARPAELPETNGG